MGIDSAKFTRLIKDFEAALGPGMRTPEYREEVVRWRKAVFQKVERFDEDVVRKALDSLSDSAEKWLPPAGAILAACEDAAKKPVERQKPKSRRMTHQCITCTENSALRDLAAILPYEAAHVGCPITQAICPMCAKHFQQVNPIIGSLMAARPDETVGWTAWHKGYLICEKCAEGGD